MQNVANKYMWVLKTLFIGASICTLSACGGSGDGGGDDDNSPVTPQSHSISGTAYGITTPITLSIEGTTSNVTVAADGAFTFSEPLTHGNVASLTVDAQPEGRHCLFNNATPTVNANISNLTLICNTEGRFRVGVTVSGLNNTGLELQLNDTPSETLLSNGLNFLTAELNDKEPYDLIIINHPDELACFETNEVGLVQSNHVTNILIECRPRNLVLEKLSLITEDSSSIVAVTARVKDKRSGQSFTGLTTNDFIILEDGLTVSPSESFLTVDSVNQIPYTFHTIIGLDISKSLSLENIETMKQAIINYVAKPDPANAENYISRLLPGQEISIYTFDEDITEIIRGTSDVNKIINEVKKITQGKLSTDLYNMIKTGLAKWENTFRYDNVEFGTLLIVTDGTDTAARLTLDQALANKKDDQSIYILKVGSEIEENVLAQITASENIFSLESLESLEEALVKVSKQATSFANGLYIIYYASPKRAGEHKISINLKGNTTCASTVLAEDCSHTITGVFDATNFISPEAALVVKAPSNAEAGTTINLAVNTQWSNYTPAYNWTILNDVSATLMLAVNTDDSSYATLTIPEEYLAGRIYIEIEDSNNIDSETGGTLAVIHQLNITAKK